MQLGMFALPCTCPAGAGLGCFGNCNHIGGVLFALEDFNRKGYQDCPEPVSCTSKLCAWNVPTSFVSVAPKSIDETVIRKIKFGKDSGISTQPKYLCFDSRMPTDRQVDEKDIQELQAKLASCLPNSRFFAFHSTGSPPSNEQSVVAETVPSLLSPFDDANVMLMDSLDSQPFSDSYDIACSNFKDMMDYQCLMRINIGDEEISNIELYTQKMRSGNH